VYHRYSGQYAPALSNKLHPCSGTLACDNEEEMVNKRYPWDPFKWFFFIVTRNLHRTTCFIPYIAIKNHLIRTKCK